MIYAQHAGVGGLEGDGVRTSEVEPLAFSAEQRAERERDEDDGGGEERRRYDAAAEETEQVNGSEHNTIMATARITFIGPGN